MGRTGKTRQDWVHGGQRLLIKGGINAVKLRALTQQLGVSSGSFYHHFKNFDVYLTALADYYGTEQAQQLFLEARDDSGDDPARLLRNATNLFGTRAGRQLNIAMRFWGNNDERAAAAVRRYDAVLAENLMTIFGELGFDRTAAKSRTVVMLGLASLEFDSTLLDTELHELWPFIRDNMLLPRSDGLLASPQLA